MSAETSRKGGRALKIVGWTLLSLLLLAAVARVSLKVFAKHYTEDKLEQSEEYRGSFNEVQEQLFPPRYSINDLKLVREKGGDPNRPVLQVGELRVDLLWRRLLDRQLVLQLRAMEPEVLVVSRARETGEVTEPSAVGLQKSFSGLAAMSIERFAIQNGTLRLVHVGADGAKGLTLHRIEAVLQNVATRKDLATGAPTLVTLSARVEQSGELSLFLSADAWADEQHFAGRAELLGLRLAEINDFLAAGTDLKATQGTLDVFVEFEVRGNRVTGGIKPVIHNLDTAPEDLGFMDRLKSWAADAAVKLFGNENEGGKEEVATVVPLDGTLSGPRGQLLPSVVGVLRNAFVEGVGIGFQHLPPPKAGEKQSAPEQLGKGLQEESFPRAQPRKGPAPAEGRPTVPVVTEPEGLLLPGALRRIQEELVRRGFLEGSHDSSRLDRATQAALERFQRMQGLAATGFPDDETVNKLGLDPKQAFRGESARR